MSRPARKAARVKTRVNPSVLAASVLALVLLAVPGALIANARPSERVGTWSGASGRRVGTGVAS